MSGGALAKTSAPYRTANGRGAGHEADGWLTLLLALDAPSSTLLYSHQVHTQRL